MENGGAFQYAFCLSLTALEALGGQSLCEAFSGESSVASGTE